jgi:hypothetical protein
MAFDRAPTGLRAMPASASSLMLSIACPRGLRASPASASWRRTYRLRSLAQAALESWEAAS